MFGIALTLYRSVASNFKYFGRRRVRFIVSLKWSSKDRTRHFALSRAKNACIPCIPSTKYIKMHIIGDFFVCRESSKKIGRVSAAIDMTIGPQKTHTANYKVYVRHKGSSVINIPIGSSWNRYIITYSNTICVFFARQRRTLQTFTKLVQTTKESNNNDAFLKVHRISK